jgi:CubicO group peptidase (beta-lactamase class C family)
LFVTLSKMMRIVKFFGLAILFFLLALLSYYSWQLSPIVLGHGVKNLCSCVLVSGRSYESVVGNELGILPFSLARYSINYSDSSVEGSLLFGLAKRKAIFRKNIGCTLLPRPGNSKIRKPEINVSAKHEFVKDAVWPMGDRLDYSYPANVDSVALSKIIQEAFNDENHQRNIRAIVVIFDGKIISEQYANGFDANTMHAGWSMTKSLMNGLYGVMEQTPGINVSDPVGIPEWSNDDRSKITIDHLMHHTSGLAWNEDYSGQSNVTEMLFKNTDMAGYAIQSELIDSPGQSFNYSSGTANILSMLLHKKLGDSYYQFPYEAFFHKIGMYNTLIEMDASGNFVASSYSYATARDWGRFGLLYCNNGKWNGEQVLSENWIRYTTTPSSAFSDYGALFWLNSDDPNRPGKRFFTSCPSDMFWANGYEGQGVYIIPSKKLVVVKLALTRGEWLDENKFFADILNCIKPDNLNVVSSR